MTYWSTVGCWETLLGLAINGCCVVPYCMLICILSVSVRPLEMLCAEAEVALGPLAGDLKAESLASDVCLQEVKFILNQVLFLRHFLGSLARLGLGEFFMASPLGLEPSLAHFNRQVWAAVESLLQGFLPGLVLKVLIGLVVELIMILDKSTIASSCKSIK